MNDMLKSIGGLNAGDNIQQDNKDLIADVIKLISMVDMFISQFPTFVAEVHVAPMNIVQMTTAQLRRIKFYVVYNASLPNAEELKQECAEFLHTIIESEFNGVDDIEQPEFCMYNNWDEPTLMIRTVFNSFTTDDLSDEDYLFLYNLVSGSGAVAITIPKTYKFAMKKNVFIHAPSVVTMNTVRRGCESICSQYGKRSSEVGVDTESADFNYILMQGATPLHYDVPYIFIDSFDEQRISRLLKSDEA